MPKAARIFSLAREPFCTDKPVGSVGTDVLRHARDNYPATGGLGILD